MPLGVSTGEVFALLSALSWALTTIVVRSLSASLSPTTINLLRSGGSLLLTLAVILLWRPASLVQELPFWALGLLVASVALGPALGDTLFFESLRLIGVARAMPLAATNPLFATLFAIVLLGEQVTVRFGIGTLLVVLGVYLVAARPDAGKLRDARRGALLAVVAAMLWASGTTAVTPALREVDLLVANSIRLAVTFVFVGLYGWRSGRLTLSRRPRPRALLAITAVSALSAGSALFFLTAVQQAGAARTAALSSSSPLFAAPLALLIYREPLSARLLSGTAVTVAGIVLIVGG